MASTNGKKTGNKANRWDLANWEHGRVTLAQALGLKWKIKYPRLNASLAQQAQQSINASGAAKAVGGKNGAGDNIPRNISTGGASGTRGLFNALRSAGATQNQAVALIANAINESSLNPEARHIDSNGYYSNGLWQFNEASYPDSGSLVTGDPSRDMVAQIQYLFSHGGLSASTGTTPEQAAGNFASRFEDCQGCQPGGAQYNQRVGNVATVLQELGLK